MIKMPDFSKYSFYTDNFYLTSAKHCLGKTIAEYELFKRTLDIPGAIIECGVFRGASLIRFATLRDLFSDASLKKVIGFDMFNGWPEAKLATDKRAREDFIKSESASAISKGQLLEVFERKGIINVELVEGDIVTTVPKYVEQYPELKISFLHIDIAIFETMFTVLKSFYEKIVSGGILLFSDYGATSEGSTKAIEIFFGTSNLPIRRFPFSPLPYYLIKGEELEH